MKATERLHWLSLDDFFELPREKQILILVYAQERDEEDAERSLMNALPIPVPGA